MQKENHEQMKKLKFIISFLVLALIVVSCGSKGSEDSNSLSGKVNVDGSSTVYPVTEAMAEEFRLPHPDVRVTIGVSGTGGGFKKFSRGETDISDASRPIKESEAQAAKDNNIDFVELSVAYDGLAVLINPENDWVDKLTLEELKIIWEPEAQGTITRWSQIREGWPDEEIHLFGPGIASGTYDYFTEAITGESGSSRGDYTASEDDNVLVQGIATDKFGLGFFGLAYYSENRDKLKLAPIDNGDDVVVPSMESVKDGSYSPLSRPLFIYVSSKGTERPEVVEFVRFYLENVGSFVGEVGYIPLPDELYDEQRAKFEEFLK